MVVLSNPPLEEIFLINSTNPSAFFTNVPVVDLSHPVSATATIVKACSEYGFFKIRNHGISTELIEKLETKVMEFFTLPEMEKETVASLSDLLGYGNKRIGSNGEVGWLEYLLLEVNSMARSLSFLGEPWASSFGTACKDYVTAVQKLAAEILDLMAEGLGMKNKKKFSKLVMDKNSDSFLRLNHYPACPKLEGFHMSLKGFGEHTDPQIISVLRSNNSSGLEIALKDGSWVLVPPDQDSFFVNVGDSLQVLTNGRFRSVRHRVVTNGERPRLSMVYFGGPPLTKRIAPLRELMSEGEESKYREFTWAEYKTIAFKSRLADNRLGYFEEKEIASEKKIREMWQSRL